MELCHLISYHSLFLCVKAVDFICSFCSFSPLSYLLVLSSAIHYRIEHSTVLHFKTVFLNCDSLAFCSVPHMDSGLLPVMQETYIAKLLESAR